MTIILSYMDFLMGKKNGKTLIKERETEYFQTPQK